MATDSAGNKLTTVMMSSLIGVVLTGAGMVIRGDFIGREAAGEVEVRINKTIEDQKMNQDWVNNQILLQLKEIRDKLDKSYTGN